MRTVALFCFVGVMKLSKLTSYLKTTLINNTTQT